MKVKELMKTEPMKYCSSDTKLANVAKIMKESNLGALPVVDKDKKVIGIVTDRDVCLSLSEKTDKKATDVTVKDILPKMKVHTVTPDANITDALREMRKNRIGRLPVTNKEGKLEGIISVNQLLSHAVTESEELGKTSSKDENLAKTIKALFDRNSSNVPSKRQAELELEESSE